jgi:hypothetical protein
VIVCRNGQRAYATSAREKWPAAIPPEPRLLDATEPLQSSIFAVRPVITNDGRSVTLILNLTGSDTSDGRALDFRFYQSVSCPLGGTVLIASDGRGPKALAVAVSARLVKPFAPLGVPPGGGP